MTIRAAHAGNRPAPIFTIVVPTYNSDAYAARCLDSLRHQGLREGEAEVRMVDDGSHPDFFSRLGRLCEGRDDVILDRQDRNAAIQQQLAAVTEQATTVITQQVVLLLTKVNLILTLVVTVNVHCLHQKGCHLHSQLIRYSCNCFFVSF